MILKTYTRIFTNDAEETLRVLRPLHAGEPHLRFRFDPWELVGIGDVLVVAGTNDALAPIRGSLGPWIVPHTDETQIADIRLTTRVNGETRQDDRTGRLIFGFRYLLNYISTFTTLVPGDVIEIEAEGVGILRNGVVDETSSVAGN